MHTNKYLDYINALNEIGIALSSERQSAKILEMILAGSMKFTNADAGTLYLLEDHVLSFSLFGNNTLKIKPRGMEPGELTIKPIRLYDENGNPNYNNVTSYCALKGKTIKIDNAYETSKFDFSGTRAIDKKLNYKSVSFLTVPLSNHENEIIGVLQLINSIDPENQEIVPFSEEAMQLAESLASQAAIIITQKKLVESHKELFDAFIKLIAKTIDEKSAYTSNHCTRVPIITMMIANALNNEISDAFREHYLSKSDLEELRVAAWLHDCGKVATPENVMDKPTKLSAISDRMEVIKLRLEILRRDMEIELLKKSKISSPKETENIETNELNSIKELQSFLAESNKGGERLTEENKQKIRDAAKKFSYTDMVGNIIPLLTQDDVNNLIVERGTLNPQEREIIKNHVKITATMLESLPYPKSLRKVPLIAGSHHEMIDGKGYPKGLKGDQLILQARILAIADIFEALTAADRPYKNAKPLSETLNIMKEMKKNNHIDPDLFDLFVKQKIYLDYAKQYLKPEQIDIEDFEV